MYYKLKNYFKKNKLKLINLLKEKKREKIFRKKLIIYFY